jgi:hypothetical protein
VDYVRAIDRFNAELMRSPIVFADEENLGPRDHNTLKELIARDGQTVNTKFEPEIHIHGSLRLIIASNECTLFAGTRASELTKQALAQRIVYIPVDEAPRDYLRTIGGRDATADWVDGDKIARFALWLRDNRHVKPGKRFLVEGSWSEAIDRLDGTDYERDRLLKWIAAQVTETDALRSVDGAVYFRVEPLVSALNEDTARRLTLKAIGACLTELGADENGQRPKLPRGVRYRGVPATVLRNALEDIGLTLPSFIVEV